MTADEFEIRLSFEDGREAKEYLSEYLAFCLDLMV